MTVDEIQLEEAVQVILTVHKGNKPVPIDTFVNATDVVLDAMRKEITCSEVINWCLQYRSLFESGEENNDNY